MKGTLNETVFMGRMIHIYLPPSYQADGDRYPVVYIQDGGYLFLKQLTKLEAMFSAGTLPELIFVGVTSCNRNAEYTPWKARALAARYDEFGGQGSSYLSFLINDLKVYIDAEYRTHSDCSQTAIAGASLGGLISMYALCRQPDIFGKFASLSGSFWYEGFVDFMKADGTVYAGQKIYMDVGEREGNGKESIQRNMVGRNKEVHEILLQKGFAADQCRLFIVKDAIHEQAFFIERFPSALQWLFQEGGEKRELLY